MTAWLWLTLASIRRLLREPRVARSLAWPVFFAPVVMGSTLAVLAVMNAPLKSAAVPASLDPSLRAALEREGWELVVVGDPGAAVRSGELLLATDGRTVWTETTAQATLNFEALIRTHHGSAWRMGSAKRLPPPEELRNNADLLMLAIDLLFVLYGLAFGMGSLARDRDQQILDVELTLPVRAWIPAAARWAAATTCLGGAAVLTTVLFQVFTPCNDPVGTAARTVGAIGAAAAVGVAMVGGAGLKSGFAGPFAAGSVLVAGAFVAGPSVPGGEYLPIASLIARGPGWVSLALGLASGPAAAWWFEIRLRRST